MVETRRNSEIMINKSRSETERSYNELVERFRKWAENRLDTRAAVAIGSRAQVDHPADEWADLDLVIVTTDPKHMCQRPIG